VRWTLLLLLVACGGHQQQQQKQIVSDDDLASLSSGPGESEPPPPEDELHRRQYAACEQIIPRMTSCAVDDAKKNMTAEQLKNLDVDATAKIHTREYTKKCKKCALNGYQVRVLEVCYAQTDNCDDLRDCLDNLNKRPPPK